MDLSWLDVWWLSQLIIVASTYFLGLSQASSETPKDQKPAGVKLAFYQFNKRISTYYLFGLAWALWVGWTVSWGYLFGSQPGEYFIWLTYTLVPVKRKLTTDPTSVLLALSLLEVHLIRRLYESLKISIFSKRQALNIVDVLLSLSFYAAAALSAIADGPDIAKQQMSLSDLGVRHLIALPVYILASINQQQANKTFAKLRRNRFGHIVTTNYGKPKGGWFEFVSSPHYLAEVLIYCSIGLVLGPNGTTWLLLCAFLITQQIISSLGTHAWYQKKFEDYPTSRKAIIPFIL